MRRRNNQDNYAVVMADDAESWERSGHLLIVADGMGAHAAGELASRLSVELIPHHYAKLNKGEAAESLQKSLSDTNTEIFRRGQANPEFRSMGTTTSVLGILPEGAVVAHVGDSRVYRLRGQQFEQLTFDHSLVWEMRATGDLSDEAAQNNSIPKNVITRSLGPNANVAVDLEGPFPLKLGDKFLLCSDGLSGQMTDEEMGVLLQVLDPERAVHALIDLANLRGGPDNITVLIGEVCGESLVTHGATAAAKLREDVDGFPLVFGIVGAICALAAVVLVVLGQFPIALVSAAASGVAFISGWIKYQSKRYREGAGRVYGKGPYRKYTCKPDIKFTQQLKGVINELNDWIKERKWDIESDVIKSSIQQAQKGEESKDYASAIRNYVVAIVTTMREIERRQDSQANDSSIEY